MMVMSTLMMVMVITLPSSLTTGQAIEEVIRTQWLNTPFSNVDRLIGNEISMSEDSDGSAPFEMEEDQLENEKTYADEDEVQDADLKEAIMQPRRKNRLYIRNAALAEKYAKKRLASKLKRRQIKAHSKRRSTLIRPRKGLSAAGRRKATIERSEQRVRRSRNRQRNEDLRPLENFVLEDPLYPSEKCDHGTDTADIEVPGIEREPTPTMENEDESDEDTSDEAYYQRHLPMETEEKVVNAERRRLMRAWMKRRQALLKRQESLSWSMGRSRSSSLNDSTADYPNGMGSPTAMGSPANTSITIEAVDSRSAHSDEGSE
ncbi:hypothetical protein TTRE_0000691401 [Trichuris trichiura]|uniref:Uncharacterized protein n=1 Tax=Trichuris trichiura TaxID=36087 RepID=A0A077ZE05_TRITR|nr:hypothetical protein TTRE_0000691401 [Trichuris trichiura]